MSNQTKELETEKKKITLLHINEYAIPVECKKNDTGYTLICPELGEFKVKDKEEKEKRLNNIIQQLLYEEKILISRDKKWERFKKSWNYTN